MPPYPASRALNLPALAADTGDVAASPHTGPRAALLAVALAAVLAGCGGGEVAAPGPPVAPDGIASPSGYAAGVRKGADAMRDFARELDRVSPAHLKDRATSLEAARQAFATAVGESAAARAPALLADADRRLVAAWRDVDRAMRDVVAAAAANDPERYEAARLALARTVERVEHAADGFAAV